MRFTWSAISISAPREKVRRTPPAALVRIRVRTPSAAKDPHRQRHGLGRCGPRTYGSARSARAPACRPACRRPARPGAPRRWSAGNPGISAYGIRRRAGSSLAGERPEPAAQDDGDSGTAPRRSRMDRAAASTRGSAPAAGSAHRSMPAIVAERKLASVPASMARKPSRARSRFALRAPARRCRRSGCRPS